MKRLSGRQPDGLITALAVFGLIADAGWLNPLPSVEDAPNAALGVLKAFAKQLPEGAARDALAEMVEKAIRNPDELQHLVDLTAALGKHSDVLEKLINDFRALGCVV